MNKEEIKNLIAEKLQKLDGLAVKLEAEGCSDFGDSDPQVQVVTTVAFGEEKTQVMWQAEEDGEVWPYDVDGDFSKLVELVTDLDLSEEDDEDEIVREVAEALLEKYPIQKMYDDELAQALVEKEPAREAAEEAERLEALEALELRFQERMAASYEQFSDDELEEYLMNNFACGWCDADFPAYRKKYAEGNYFSFKVFIDNQAANGFISFD